MKKEKQIFNEYLIDAVNFVQRVPYLSYISENIRVGTSKNKELKVPYVISLIKEKDKEVNCINVEFKKDKNLSYQQMAFTLLVINFYCAFGYITEKEEENDETTAKFLYSFYYVYNNLKVKSVPSFWLDIEKVISSISGKNKSSVLRSIQENKSLLKDILNSTLFFEKPEVSVQSYCRVSYSFENAFKKGLISAAKNKITSGAIVYENKNHPVQTRFFNKYPFFAGMAGLFTVKDDIQLCQNIGIYYGAINYSAKLIYLNPMHLVNDDLMDFVFAHEMLHAALKHSQRQKNRDHLMWNLACDFVINQWLVEMKVGLPPPDIYLDRTLAGYSAEEIYEMIKRDKDLLKEMSTMRSPTAGHKYGKTKDKEKTIHSDMFEEDKGDFGDLSDAATRAMLQGYHVCKNMDRGNIPAGLEEEIKVLTQPSIPWEVELATWLARFFPDENKIRSYSRASRRPSINKDIPNPAYVKPQNATRTKTFGVVLDTSLSMDNKLLGKCLGAIAAYAKQHEVFQVRVVFCDTEPYDAGYIDVENIKGHLKVMGRGGTYLQNAVNYLNIQKDFPNNAPVLVLSDGFFEESLNVPMEHAFLVPDKFLLKGRKNVFEFS